MNLEKEEDHHHHHHRENVSENISIGREEKRERDTRASFAIEKKGLDDDDDDTSHTSPRIIGEKREKERKFSNSSHKKKRRGFQSALRNGRKTRTLLPPPPGFVVEVVDFRAGFFSTSSSENRFGVGARRALFLSLILLNRVFFVNVRSLVLIIGAASFFLSFVHTNNNSLALLLFFLCPQCKPSRFLKP